MSTYLYCRVVDSSKGRVLAPDNAMSEALLAKVPIGRPVMVKTKTARNPKQHRLLWALATKVADNCERFDDAEHVVDEFKLNTGHVKRRQIRVPGLGIVFQEQPASIKYESMPQEEFAVWFEKVLAYIASDIWPGLPTETIRAEIAEMMGDDWWPERKTPRAREKVDA